MSFILVLNSVYSFIIKFSYLVYICGCVLVTVLCCESTLL